ncbi:hypothetical protein ESCO_001098 [Escovopsis weberi]|uniref:SAGA-associated factor 73 n=1 Tax=Escovopsis weberi TaxID=150374 RepID=A0A0M9VT99_ESCWE|nr:hypothetical protein ESCO_001098 [Escovopsis weberi]
MEALKGDEQSTIRVASSSSSKKDSKTGAIKLRKPPPKIVKAGNWKDGTVIDKDEQKKSSNNTPSMPSSPGPMVSLLDDGARDTFATGRPLEDSPELLQCKHCKKSVLKTAAKVHIAQCLKVKREKAQRKKEAREARERAKEIQREEEARRQEEENGDAKDEDSEVEEEKKVAPVKKVAGKKPGDDKGGKKRKADGDAEKAPKAKKKKDEPKVKVPKPKEAALDANAPLEDDDEMNNGPVDSDEETAAVMNALAQWKPQPVVPNPTFVPIRRQYQLARLHEQLQMATNGGRTNIFAVTGFGVQRFPESHPGHPGHSSHNAQAEMEDAPGEPEPAGQPASSRSASFGMPAPPPRSISVSSRA